MGHEQAWLRYRKAENESFRPYLTGVCANEEDDVVRSAIREPTLAARAMSSVDLPLGLGTGNRAFA